MEFTRRRLLLGLTLAMLPRPVAAQPAEDREHRPQLEIPLLSEDPAAVPVQVSIEHPMEPDHYIRSIEITVPTDPVPHKGTFAFSPGNGRALVAFRMRSGAGGVARAVAECTRHGRFTSTREYRVAEGGCATADRGGRERPRNAQVRLPQTLRPGEVAEVRARCEYNSDTGLALKGGRYVREAAEVYLRELSAYLDDRKICEFRLSSAISSNPIFRFPFRVPQTGTLRVVFVDHEGHRAEASQAIRL